MEELIKKLLDNKASQSNSIDLDAYAQGLSDMATELLEQRNEMLEALKAIEENGTGYVISYDDLQEVRELLNKIQP